MCGLTGSTGNIKQMKSFGHNFILENYNQTKCYVPDSVHKFTYFILNTYSVLKQYIDKCGP